MCADWEAPSVEPSPSPAKPFAHHYTQFFSSSDCTTGALRPTPNTINDRAGQHPPRMLIPAAPHGGCVDIGNGHSLGNDHCDFSVSPPVRSGLAFATPNCSGTPYPYNDVADGSTCAAVALPSAVGSTWCGGTSCVQFHSLTTICVPAPTTTASVHFVRAALTVHTDSLDNPLPATLAL